MARGLAVGDEATAQVFGPVTRGDIVRYAGASGDFNPIHYDEGFATGSGFPTVFAMGMYHAGILAGFATEWLGAEQIRRLGIRFKEQVWPGDMLTCRGVVTSVSERDGHSYAEVGLECVRQTGGLAVAATATFELDP
ncbi:MaoC/PaaZ C-terminal domain-containing protein [Amycolatopsis sp. GM8]|uniref:MaoC/PaaZ C-terminal domain-containing protein n=1 Tax=Amycolatopsis sp. GM8 TaxID=2896530 RepID=UPI001F36FD34|nr:MaoC/PaaZ C-terminal domain-containing protein [Amycolatopsis sp. GM8]